MPRYTQGRIYWHRKRSVGSFRGALRAVLCSRPTPVCRSPWGRLAPWWPTKGGHKTISRPSIPCSPRGAALPMATHAQGSRWPPGGATQSLGIKLDPNPNFSRLSFFFTFYFFMVQRPCADGPETVCTWSHRPFIFLFFSQYFFLNIFFLKYL